MEQITPNPLGQRALGRTLCCSGYTPNLCTYPLKGRSIKYLSYLQVLSRPEGGQRKNSTKEHLTRDSGSLVNTTLGKYNSQGPKKIHLMNTTYRNKTSLLVPPTRTSTLVSDNLTSKDLRKIQEKPK